MVGTRRAALLALVGVAVIVVAPDPSLAFALVDAAILLAMLADVALSAQLKNLQVARSGQGDPAARAGPGHGDGARLAPGGCAARSGTPGRHRRVRGATSTASRSPRANSAPWRARSCPPGGASGGPRW